MQTKNYQWPWSSDGAAMGFAIIFYHSNIQKVLIIRAFSGRSGYDRNSGERGVSFYRWGNKKPALVMECGLSSAEFYRVILPLLLSYCLSSEVFLHFSDMGNPLHFVCYPYSDEVVCLEMSCLTNFFRGKHWLSSDVFAHFESPLLNLTML